MNKAKVYQKIKELAYHLIASEEVYTRADLAYDLQDFGITSDGLEVSKLIWEAYEHYRKDYKIKNAFLNNEWNRTVVEEYHVHYLVEQKQQEALFSLVNKILQNGKHSLHSLENELSASMNSIVSGTNSDIVGRITGTKAVSDVQVKANFLYERYTSLINTYEEARADVKIAMADFVVLRGNILKIYREYVMKLIDVYGESIKSVAPEMFDFDSVQFLNVENMLKNVQLEYDQISENCATLMNEISDSFSKSLNESAKGYKSMGNKSAGLVLAGLTMVNHYLGASEKANKSRQELEILKQNIKHDVTTIKGDFARIALIFKTLNDLYIPKANVFYKYSEQVLSNELNQLFESLYQNPEIKKMVEQREQVLADMKRLENQITDNQLNIDYYSQNVKNMKTLLVSKDDEYQYALHLKPAKPFFLFNLLTLGSLGKSYNRNIYEWNMTCAPVIREYENYKVEIKIDGDELEKHRKSLKKNQAQVKRLQLELKNLNQVINNKIRVSDDTKQQVLKHLEPIVKLLRIGKEIIESKLDQKLIQTVNINDCRSTELPEDLKNNIHNFTNKLQNSFQTSQLLPEILTEGLEEDTDIEFITQTSEQIIQRSFEVFESWTLLKAQQTKGIAVGKAYDEELRKLQQEFNKSFANIDNQSEILANMLKKINTAKDAKQLKEGLLALLDSNDGVKKEDLKQFINGLKTIEI
ncbi:hypothetical protein LJC72_00270 [Bacteroides sp. OttesenSCG-928-D19]|nr:hypothetical protein [Bacteroides sp. OttesenSCG-928-D19]